MSEHETDQCLGIQTGAGVAKGPNEDAKEKNAKVISTKKNEKNKLSNTKISQKGLSKKRPRLHLGGQTFTVFDARLDVYREYRVVKRKKLYNPKEHYMRIQIPRKGYFYRSHVAFKIPNNSTEPNDRTFFGQPGQQSEQKVQTSRVVQPRPKDSSIYEKGIKDISSPTSSSDKQDLTFTGETNRWISEEGVATENNCVNSINSDISSIQKLNVLGKFFSWFNPDNINRLITAINNGKLSLQFDPEVGYKLLAQNSPASISLTPDGRANLLIPGNFTSKLLNNESSSNQKYGSTQASLNKKMCEKPEAKLENSVKKLRHAVSKISFQLDTSDKDNFSKTNSIKLPKNVLSLHFRLDKNFRGKKGNSDGNEVSKSLSIQSFQSRTYINPTPYAISEFTGILSNRCGLWSIPNRHIEYENYFVWSGRSDYWNNGPVSILMKDIDLHKELENYLKGLTKDSGDINESSFKKLAIKASKSNFKEEKNRKSKDSDIYSNSELNSKHPNIRDPAKGRTSEDEDTDNTYYMALDDLHTMADMKEDDVRLFLNKKYGFSKNDSSDSLETNKTENEESQNTEIKNYEPEEMNKVTRIVSDTEDTKVKEKSLLKEETKEESFAETPFNLDSKNVHSLSPNEDVTSDSCTTAILPVPEEKSSPDKIIKLENINNQLNKKINSFQTKVSKNDDYVDQSQSSASCVPALLPIPEEKLNPDKIIKFESINNQLNEKINSVQTKASKSDDYIEQSESSASCDSYSSTVTSVEIKSESSGNLKPILAAQSSKSEASTVKESTPPPETSDGNHKWTPTLPELIDIYQKLLHQNKSFRKPYKKADGEEETKSNSLFAYLNSLLKEKMLDTELSKDSEVFIPRALTLTSGNPTLLEQRKGTKENFGRIQTLQQYVSMFQEVLLSSLSIEQISRLNHIMASLQDYSIKNYESLKFLQENFVSPKITEKESNTQIKNKINHSQVNQQNSKTLLQQSKKISKSNTNKNDEVKENVFVNLDLLGSSKTANESVGSKKLAQTVSKSERNIELSSLKVLESVLNSQLPCSKEPKKTKTKNTGKKLMVTVSVSGDKIMIKAVSEGEGKKEVAEKDKAKMSDLIFENIANWNSKSRSSIKTHNINNNESIKEIFQRKKSKCKKDTEFKKKKPEKELKKAKLIMVSQAKVPKSPCNNNTDPPNITTIVCPDPNSIATKVGKVEKLLSNDSQKNLREKKNKHQEDTEINKKEKLNNSFKPNETSSSQKLNEMTIQVFNVSEKNNFFLNVCDNKETLKIKEKENSEGTAKQNNNNNNPQIFTVLKENVKAEIRLPLESLLYPKTLETPILFYIKNESLQKDFNLENVNEQNNSGKAENVNTKTTTTCEDSSSPDTPETQNFSCCQVESSQKDLNVIGSQTNSVEEKNSNDKSELSLDDLSFESFPETPEVCPFVDKRPEEHNQRQPSAFPLPKIPEEVRESPVNSDSVNTTDQSIPEGAFLDAVQLPKKIDTVISEESKIKEPNESAHKKLNKIVKTSAEPENNELDKELVRNKSKSQALNPISETPSKKSVSALIYNNDLILINKSQSKVLLKEKKEEVPEEVIPLLFDYVKIENKDTRDDDIHKQVRIIFVIFLRN